MQRCFLHIGKRTLAQFSWSTELFSTFNPINRDKGLEDPDVEHQGKERIECLSPVHTHCPWITCHSQQQACISLISLFSRLLIQCWKSLLPLMPPPVPVPFSLPSLPMLAIFLYPWTSLSSFLSPARVCCAEAESWAPSTLLSLVLHSFSQVFGLLLYAPRGHP